MSDESERATGRTALSESGVVPAIPMTRAGGERGDGRAWIATLLEAQQHRYTSEGVLAQGGMGSIESIHERPLDRRLVRKTSHAFEDADGLHTTLFVREARITGQLQHPGIVPVHELGVQDGDQVYYTMDRVEGRTLEEWIRTLPAEPLDRAALFDLLDVIVRVCETLSFAHSRGVLHCDIKPANVMIGAFGQVYLMDWGIARYLADEEGRPDSGGPILGTPTHMPPEQARGGRLDVRADVFGVGTLLYHVLTRRPPYQGEGVVHTLLNAYLCEYAHPDTIPAATGTPPALTRIVVRAMAADPTQRYASVAELRDALVSFMRGVDAFPRVTLPAGHDVVREGEQGHEAYVIESGRCEVHRLVNGERTFIRAMGAGEVFGEMAILAPGPRTASVTTTEPTVLWRITAATLEAEMESMKPWMGALVRTLAERFRDRESSR